MAFISDAEQTLALEKKAIELQKITIEQLMNSAGKAVAAEAIRCIEKWVVHRKPAESAEPASTVVIVCGKGNNAGDGFVAAGYLRESGVQVKVLMLYKDAELSGEALKAYEKLPKNIVLPFEQNISILDEADIIIDAIFGFGFKPPIKNYESKAIEAINNQKAFKIAVDVPSGLEASTGEAQDGKVVGANQTICFSCIKKGLLTNKGPLIAGKITAVEIGIEPKLVQEYSTAKTIEQGYVKKLLPGRGILSHKKSVGKVLVIAGSAQYSGAAVLTAEAALRTGAGLVTLVVPNGIRSLIQEKITPEVIVKGLGQTDESAFSVEAVHGAKELLEEHDVLAIGPGLTANKGTQQFVTQLLGNIRKPATVDADALTALAVSRESCLPAGTAGVGSPENIFNKINTSVVLTPHAGELAKLTGLTVEEIERNRLNAAQSLSSDKINVILKGRYSVVSSKEKTMVNMTSNPGMATAGSGDVLTGMIAALNSQGLRSFEAATTAAFLHGLAGDIAAEELTEYSLIATDIINFIPYAIKETLNTKSNLGFDVIKNLG